MDPRENEKHPGYMLEENLKKALTELIMLFLLSQKDCYIGELTESISQRSNGALSIVFPYSTIYRLLQSAYIVESEKRNAPDGRRRQYYHITQKGLDHLDNLLLAYRSFSKNVENVINTEGE